MLYKVDDEIWCVDELMSIEKGLLPFAIPRFLGTMQIRMTVVRLSEGRLFIHSPICPTAQLVNSLNKLGRVSYIVCPNVMHTKYIQSFAEKFPEAAVFVAPKSQKRRAELSKYTRLDDEHPIDGIDLQQCFIDGHTVRETAFYHVRSKTLIVADLAYNVGKEASFIGKCWMSLFGAYGHFSLPSYHKKAVRDAVKLRNALDKVNTWDFNRVVMSHGSILNENAKCEFQRIWSWL